MFNAIVVDKSEGGYNAAVRPIEESLLSAGDVLVQVEASTLNYKDGLAITGRAPVIRQFPMVPGIDLAGTVLRSDHPAHRAGDKVLLNGFGVGESHTGGLAQQARVKGEWLLPVPAAFSAAQAMAIGTAGYTAMLCVMALQRQGLAPGMGDVLVTGAAGGVGSVAVSLLAGLGFRVLASTGRPHEADYLKALGAAEIVDRASLSAPGKPLARERWIGAVDTVGSHTLANVCASTCYGGVVTACGLAQGLDLPASVAPFILRGISLIGIDSVQCPMPERTQAWQRLAQELKLEHIQNMTTTVGLHEAIAKAGALLQGQVRGRVVVDVNR